ncbi:asparagine synthase-related protein [Paenibacillus soyae]|uniref:asparagine synthase (glutamine-hydrolyzing) n=1 Tax=Paenibacillus soyae TaxID=2969249 RepID=A0A9X2MIP8_9BACL|nr:asparagine synthase-related protein [Paenibacillus soyae]MCR2802528.1 asparagine synthase-related protein [Paenibacillus soyae]
MSAICCLHHLQSQPLPTGLGPALMEKLAHYPADSIDSWQERDVFLGCHGQWITPEARDEKLPRYDRDLQLAITSDAIIDNRSELFAKLQVPAAERGGMTDSRLLLLAYRRWGQEMAEHLVGDFAFIIWDGRDRSLFGARDFSGTRNLYFAERNGLVAFCTAIRPLLSLPGIDRELNEGWISEFLAIPITTEAVDLFSSVYKHVRQIPPAHCFTISGGQLTFRRYITIRPGESLKLKSNEEYEEAFRDVYREAISSKLRTFREVGANLSGGLDSGSVVSFAARELKEQNKTLHTFSYVPLEDFQDWTPRSRVANERSLIQETVGYVGNIRDRYFDFPDMNPLSEVDEWLDMMETPYKFYENSFWMKGIYEQASQTNAGVLLTGSRGNWTVSWGPVMDYQAGLMRRFRWFKLYREFNMYSNNLGANRSRLYRYLVKKAYPGLAKRLSRAPQEEDPIVPDLINPEFAKRTNVYERLEQYGYDFWGQSSQDVYEVRRKQFEKLYYWTITGTVGCKQSLRHKLWERDATNDLRVIRFCLSVPQDQFVQNGYGRSLIRRSTSGYLPDSIRLNQKVRGIQGADGLHRILPMWPAFIGEAEQLVADPEMKDFLNMQELTKALEAVKHSPDPKRVFDTDFRILMRGLIFRRFVRKHA